MFITKEKESRLWCLEQNPSSPYCQLCSWESYLTFLSPCFLFWHVGIISFLTELV